MNTTTKPSGWVAFVWVYLAVAGVLNLLWGIAALAERRNFDEADLVWSTLGVWGWVAVILGAVQIVGAILVWQRKAGGPIIAGFLAFLGLLVNFLAIGAHPIWSAVLLVVNALVIWAATVHSDEFL